MATPPTEIPYYSTPEGADNLATGAIRHLFHRRTESEPWGYRLSDRIEYSVLDTVNGLTLALDLTRSQRDTALAENDALQERAEKERAELINRIEDLLVERLGWNERADQAERERDELAAMVREAREWTASSVDELALVGRRAPSWMFDDVAGADERSPGA
jgi:hypothetical protein